MFTILLLVAACCLFVQNEATTHHVASAFTFPTTLQRRKAASTSSCLHSSTTSSDNDQPTIKIPKHVTGVTLKLAFDSSPHCWGIADLSAEKSERFTSPQSLDMVHRLRAISDCVLVGRGTVVADDCTLTVRRGAEKILEEMGRSQPVRVVLDPKLKLLRDSNNERTVYKMFDDGLPAIIYHLGADVTQEIENMLKERPAVTIVDVSKLMASNEKAVEAAEDVVVVQGGSLATFSISSPPPTKANNAIPPELVVQDLQSRGLQHIMVEGGAAMALLFLRAGMVDRAIIVKASVQFKEPLPSNIDERVLESAGLRKLGDSSGEEGDGDTGIFGGDCLEYWVKDDGDEEGRWPTDVLVDWP